MDRSRRNRRALAILGVCAAASWLGHRWLGDTPEEPPPPRWSVQEARRHTSIPRRSRPPVSMPPQRQTVTIDNIELNVELDDERFAFPEAEAATDEAPAEDEEKKDE